MSKEERRQKEKQEMKVRIQDAAIEIIQKEGYENLSLRKIAAKIDYSATNIYNYYQNKAEIIEHVILRKSMAVVKTVEEGLTKKQDLPIDEQFLWLVKTFIQAMLKDPEQVRAVFQTGINIYGEYEGIEDDIDGESKIQGFLDQGYQQGLFRKMKEVETTLLIVNILGAVSLIINNQIQDKKQIDAIIQAESTLLLKGILK